MKFAEARSKSITGARPRSAPVKDNSNKGVSGYPLTSIPNGATTMNKLTAYVFASTFLLGTATVYASSLDLEPCMNGDVSASGTFPSQEAEDRFRTLVEQEPCINSDVPPDGIFRIKDTEVRFDALAEQEPCVNSDVPPDGVFVTPIDSGDLFTSSP